MYHLRGNGSRILTCALQPFNALQVVQESQTEAFPETRSPETRLLISRRLGSGALGIETESAVKSESWMSFWLQRIEMPRRTRHSWDTQLCVGASRRAAVGALIGRAGGGCDIDLSL